LGFIKDSDPLHSASVDEGEEDSDLNQITDVQFWNRYYGWYSDEAQDLGPWLDETKKLYPQRGIGVSEYGAGGSIASYQERLEKPYGHGDRDHPEKWQSYVHQRAWNEIQQRDFLIGTFVWVMFDFSSSLRRKAVMTA
jgi:beta-galactosidase